MTALSKIEGIGPSYAEKLKKVGIKTIEALLEAGATVKGAPTCSACPVWVSNTATCSKKLAWIRWSSLPSANQKTC
jgi:adenine-specific DNA glycosylase